MDKVNYLLLPFVEIELRFGTINNNRFDSNIDKKYFNKLLSVLEKNSWVSTELKNTNEYFVDQFKKLIVNHDGSKKVILKEKVMTVDIISQDNPFDIRLTVNQEFNLNSQVDHFTKQVESGTVSGLRKKNRNSFIDTHFRYDLTCVEETIDNVVREKFEMELEIIINNENIHWTKDYLVEFLRCKIYDIVNIIEQVPLDQFKLNLIF
jgi:hypothetical protein